MFPRIPVKERLIIEDVIRDEDKVSQAHHFSSLQDVVEIVVVLHALPCVQIQEDVLERCRRDVIIEHDHSLEDLVSRHENVLAVLQLQRLKRRVVQRHLRETSLVKADVDKVHTGRLHLFKIQQLCSVRLHFAFVLVDMSIVHFEGTIAIATMAVSPHKFGGGGRTHLRRGTGEIGQKELLKDGRCCHKANLLGLNTNAAGDEDNITESLVLEQTLKVMFKVDWEDSQFWWFGLPR